MNELKIGQKVWVEPIGNAARYGKDLKEAEISKIGNKYFELKDRNSSRFYIHDLIQDGKGYSPNYKVWLSKQDYEEKNEYNNKLGDIRQHIGNFGSCKLSLEQVRSIHHIISHTNG